MSEHFTDTTDFFPKMYCLSQGFCCGTGVYKVLFNEARSGCLNSWVFIPILSVPMTLIFWWNQSKNHSHNKLNGKNSYSCPVLLLSREIWPKTWQQSPSRLLKQPKKAILENRPIMHCKLSIEWIYIMYANGLCPCWCLTVSSCKITVLW